MFINKIVMGFILFLALVVLVSATSPLKRADVPNSAPKVKVICVFNTQNPSKADARMVINMCHVFKLLLMMAEPKSKFPGTGSEPFFCISEEAKSVLKTVPHLSWEKVYTNPYDGTVMAQVSLASLGKLPPGNYAYLIKSGDPTQCLLIGSGNFQPKSGSLLFSVNVNTAPYASFDETMVKSVNSLFYLGKLLPKALVAFHGQLPVGKMTSPKGNSITNTEDVWRDVTDWNRYRIKIIDSSSGTKVDILEKLPREVH